MNWNLPENCDYHYFTTKSKYIFFAFENPNTKLSSIGVYSIFLGKVFAFDAAHTKKVTDMTEANINGTNYILSASQDGSIKAWDLSDASLAFNQGITDAFTGMFNPQKLKIEVLFLNVEDVGGSPVLVAGTSDGRLLFWIGPEMNFQHVSLDPTYVTSSIFSEQSYVS